MNSHRILVPVLSLLLSIFLTLPASAKGKPVPKPKPTPVPEKVNASGDVIESVSADSIVVKSSKATLTYKIDSRTMIHANTQKGTAADLKKGMHVQVDVSSLYPGVALSITATN